MLDNLIPSEMNFLTTDRVCAVYILTHCKTGKKYIGSSGMVGTRLSSHRSSLRKGKHHVKAFQRDYDIDPDYDVVVYTVSNREDAFKLEQALLDKYFSGGRLYNQTSDAKRSSSGRTMTAAERETIGKRNRGKKFSPEWCAKISKALTGKKQTPEHRANFIKGRTGIPVGEKQREHLDQLNNSRKKQIHGDGGTYNGLMEAARLLGVHKDNIRHRIRSHLPQWAGWHYIE